MPDDPGTKRMATTFSITSPLGPYRAFVYQKDATRGYSQAQYLHGFRSWIHSFRLDCMLHAKRKVGVRSERSYTNDDDWPCGPASGVRRYYPVL